MTQSAATVSRPAVPPHAYVVLLIGIISVSLAAIFIRLALEEGVPSLVIAAGRLTVATLVLTPVTLRRYHPHLRALPRSTWLLCGISGLFLAIHFAAWVSSLQYTKVLISGVLVTTTPIWAGLLEVYFLKTRLSRQVIIGLIVALLGGAIIAFSGGDAATIDSEALVGGGLATLGAMTVAVYMVIGRRVRADLPVLPYIWVVYGIAALLLIVVVLLSGLPVTGHSAEGYLWVLAVGLVPQLLGHSSLNYALGFLPATQISIATQSEPLASAVLALILFQERPTTLQIVGSIIILIGVTLTLARGNPPEPAKPAPS